MLSALFVYLAYMFWFRKVIRFQSVCRFQVGFVYVIVH